MKKIHNEPLVIGTVRLKNNLIMAPMAGITDLPFRKLARAGGAGLVCTEMVSSKALTYKDSKTLHLMTLSKDEHPVSVQLFGSNPRDLAEAAKLAEGAGADIVDINMGCPVRKIVKTGAGAKLIENEVVLGQVMESVVKAVKVPVTIKMRTGSRPEENVAPRVVEIAHNAGVSMAVVHGRPASAGHVGKADLEAIARTVEVSRIPVVGNGGVTDDESARGFFEATGCAGLMIGRAAIGDCGLFGRIERCLAGGAQENGPTWEDRLGSLREHAALSAEHYGEKKGIVLLRKIAPYYLKGLPNASKIRGVINTIETLKALDDLLATVWDSPYFSEASSFE